MGRGGKLNINIDSVRLVDGEKVALRAVKEGKGGGHVGAMTGAIVATSIVFFPAAPLFLFMHGKDITIPKGTEITAFVNGDVPLDLAKFRPTGSPVVAASATVSGQETLEFSSNPQGADIEVDGSFVGTTPSSITVAPGDHAITIRKSGYKAWERKMKTSSGSVKVVAELEQDAKAEVVKPAMNGEQVKKE
jgi:PEGA domain